MSKPIGLSLRFIKSYTITPDPAPQRWDYWTDHLGWRLVFRGGGCE